MKRNTTRRTFVKGIAGAAAATTVVGSVSASGAEWTVEETPTGNTLYDVEYTSDGAYAVGAGGVVLRRTGRGWEKVLDGGPTGNGNNLYGSDTAGYGTTLWFVGSSGAIGEYDVAAITGSDGDNVYVAGDSGKIYYSFEDGETGTWDYTTPGSGSAVNAIDTFGSREGHAVDGNKSVFETADGATYGKIGVADANHNFYGVDLDGSDDVTVGGGGAVIARK